MKNIKLCLKIWLSFLGVMICTSFEFNHTIIKVQGSENHIKIDRQTKLYLCHLDVHEPIYICIDILPEMPEGFVGMAIPLTSPKQDTYRIFRILIDANLSNNQQMIVLAHEMIHIKQFVKKELVIHDKNNIVWRDKKYHYYPEYNPQAPWEKEADQYDYKLARLVKRSLEKDKKALAKIIPDKTDCAFHCRD